jgi:hypothetical protein
MLQISCQPLPFNHLHFWQALLAGFQVTAITMTFFLLTHLHGWFRCSKFVCCTAHASAHLASIIKQCKEEPQTSLHRAQAGVKFPSTTASLVTISITEIMLSLHLQDTMFVHLTKTAERI